LYRFTLLYKLYVTVLVLATTTATDSAGQKRGREGSETRSRKGAEKDRRQWEWWLLALVVLQVVDKFTCTLNPQDITGGLLPGDRIPPS
jgi:hypothetical protein